MHRFLTAILIVRYLRQHSVCGETTSLINKTKIICQKSGCNEVPIARQVYGPQVSEVSFIRRPSKNTTPNHSTAVLMVEWMAVFVFLRVVLKIRSGELSQHWHVSLSYLLECVDSCLECIMNCYNPQSRQSRRTRRRVPRRPQFRDRGDDESVTSRSSASRSSDFSFRSLLELVNRNHASSEWKGESSFDSEILDASSKSEDYDTDLSSGQKSAALAASSIDSSASFCSVTTSEFALSRFVQFVSASTRRKRRASANESIPDISRSISRESRSKVHGNIPKRKNSQKKQQSCVDEDMDEELKLFSNIRERTKQPHPERRRGSTDECNGQHNIESGSERRQQRNNSSKPKSKKLQRNGRSNRSRDRKLGRLEEKLGCESDHSFDSFTTMDISIV